MSTKKGLISDNPAGSPGCGDDVFRIVFEKIQTGIFIVDSSTHRIADANPIAERLLGYSRDQLIGRVCHEFVCPAGCGNCPVTDHHTEIHNAERSLINASGETVPILKTVTKATIGGHEYLIESFVDIIDRKNAEERKLSLIAYMTESVLRVRKPLGLVRQDLQFLADDVIEGEYDPEDLRLKLQVQANNIARMEKTLDDLSDHAMKENKDIPAPVREFFGECK